MWRYLDQKINEAASTLIKDHESYAKEVHKENKRRSRRSISISDNDKLPLLRPSTWDLHPGFNPYLVRSRHKCIAYTISRSLKNQTYAPSRPAGFRVQKPSGGERTISTFQISDEVVSRHLFRSLMRKNLPILSSHSYAYRADRGLYNAVSHIKAEFSHEHRIFIAEYDFKKFFDNISHSYLLEVIDEIGIIKSPLEEYLIKKFLEVPAPYLSNEKGLNEYSSSYGPSDTTPPCERKGIPQGTSISLFLANIAALKLDQKLEKLGVGFVRYADDTLIWSADYGKICDAASTLHEISDQIGSPINPKKSSGIQLLVRGEVKKAEISFTKQVDYLGHRFGLGPNTTQIKPELVQRIQKRVNHLIYTNLLLEPLRNNQDPSRISGNIDEDYKILILQLRRYLYGSLTEQEVRRFQIGDVSKISFEGIMSFFPLIDDNKQLEEIDKWIAARIWLAMRKRSNILKRSSLNTPAPHDLSKDELINYSHELQSGQKQDLRIPSVQRIANVISRGVSSHGFEVVSNKIPLYMYS